MPERLVIADLPPDYGDAPAEYQAVRERAGIVDRSALSVLEVTGKDRASFLHALVSNDVKALAPGQACAATLLDVHGRSRLSSFWGRSRAGTSSWWRRAWARSRLRASASYWFRRRRSSRNPAE